MSWWRDKFQRARGIMPVRELVQRIVDHYKLNADLRQEQLFAEWSSLVGEKIGSKTRPDTIIDRVLIVEVASSAWLQELRLMRPKIVSDLLDRLGMPRFFDDIRFVLAGERRRRPTQTRRPAQRAHLTGSLPDPQQPASGEHLREILDDTARIEDEELRAIISRVRVKHDK